MHISEGMAVPTVAEVQDLMRRERDLFPPGIDIYRVESYVHDAYDKMSNARSMLASSYPEIADKINDTFDSKMAPLIITYLGLEKYLQRTDAGGLSFSESSLASILSIPIISDSVKESIKVLAVYGKYYNRLTSMVSLRDSSFNKPDKYVRAHHHYSASGSPILYCTGLEYSGQYTGRITPSEPALGNVDRMCKDIYAVKQDYELYSVDLGQTDPRHLFFGVYRDPLLNHCINMYGDAYYGAVHYSQYVSNDYFRKVPLAWCSEKSHDELIDLWLTTKDFSDVKPMEITAEFKKARQGLKAEINGINYGKTQPENEANAEVFRCMVDRLQKHPIKIKLMNDLERQLTAGATRFKTLLGDEFDITKSPKYANYRGNIVSLLRLVIAGMIQGSTASCNRLLLMHCRKELDKMYNRIPIVLNVHDSIAFAIPKSFPAKDLLKKYIKEELMCITMDLWGKDCKIEADVEEKENKQVIRPAFVL